MKINGRATFWIIVDGNHVFSSCTSVYRIMFTNDTAKIRIYNTVMYRGDVLFNGLSSKNINSNMIVKNEVMSISENGFDFEPINYNNTVTVGKYGAKYTDLGTAITTEPSYTIFNLVDNCSVATTFNYKANIIIQGNGFNVYFYQANTINANNIYFYNCTLTFASTIPSCNLLTTDDSVFDNVKFFQDEGTYSNGGILLTYADRNIFRNCETWEMQQQTITLSYSNDNCIDFKSVKRFFKTGSTGSGAFTLSNSHRNRICCRSFDNSGRMGTIDSVFICFNSNDNYLEVGNLTVFESTAYPIVKFYTCNNNKVKFMKNEQTVNQDVYELVYSNGYYKNIIENYNAVNILKRLSLPTGLYSDSINDSSASEISLWSSTKINNALGALASQIAANSAFSTSDVGNFRTIGQVEPVDNEAINFCIGGLPLVSKKQRLFCLNSDNNTYIKVFGNNTVNDVSDVTHENLFFTKYGTTNQKMNSYNVYATTTNINSDTVNITSAVNVTGAVEINGFTKLGTGTNSIAIKNILLTGTTDNDLITSVTSGILASKIIACQVLILTDGNQLIPPGFRLSSLSGVYDYNVVIDNNVIGLMLETTATPLQVRPYQIFITYKA